MKNYSLLLLVLSFAFVACQPKPDQCTKPKGSATQNQDGTTSAAPTNCPPDDTDPDDDGDDPTDDTPLPTEVELFDISASFTNFEAADEAKVETAFDLIKVVVRTKAFRKRMLEHKWSGKKQFADNKGLSNAQIYQIFLDGAESLRPEVDHVMDLDLELYRDMGSITIGYTYANVLKIWMNRKYFDNYAAHEVSHNVFHEWAHKLGFDHDKSSTSKRPYSVPYGVGSIMLDLALQVQNGQLDPTLE